MPHVNWTTFERGAISKIGQQRDDRDEVHAWLQKA
jgi:hypothetical protein